MGDLIKKVIYKSKNILKIKGMLALEIVTSKLKKFQKYLLITTLELKTLLRITKQH